MSELVLHTYDWVPSPPRGFVRDLRLRWALEEAGLPYRVETTPFRKKTPEHFTHQPFGQVPWLTHGDISVFESGAALVYIAEHSPALMPADPKGRMQVMEWVFAALNSVEMASLPWALLQFTGPPEPSAAWKFFDGFVRDSRLPHVEKVLTGRDWLPGGFSIADILMVDVLRLVDRFGGLADFPASKAYVRRGEARPAFQKALADQMAHFAAAD